MLQEDEFGGLGYADEADKPSDWEEHCHDELLRRIEREGDDWRDDADDVKRIMQVCLERDMTVTPQQAYAAWRCHSETSAAGWLFLDDDDDIVFSCVRAYLAVIAGKI